MVLRRRGTMGKSRTEAYTDGVFAIAATLLVLDLTTTSVGEVRSDGEMWDALAAMLPNFYAFGLSFALLSLLWMIHLRQFADIERVDTALLWLNNARLLFVVLMPFTTSLTAEYYGWYAGRMLMPINFFLAALFGYLSWLWAARGEGTLLFHDSRESLHAKNMNGLGAVLSGAFAAAVSPWVGSWGFVIYFAGGPITRLLGRIVPPRGGREGAATRAVGGDTGPE